ncbi:MAG: putative iron-uptake transporter [Lachnospiraceae bacterium]|jgi:iron(III) transport system permease protein|nr:putative iron-uptake transporter [Lachnospiraceae bacterium]
MKNKVNSIRIISTILILVILAINIESVLALFKAPTDVWNHIKENLLLGYTKNTILLVAFSMLFSGLIGTSLAYFITSFEFFGRKALSILLYFPLAIPPYIGAYIYVIMMQQNGLFSNLAGRTIPINSFWMAVLVFTLFLFPYVYIGVKGYLSYNMGGFIENARVLGKGEFLIFKKVVLPLSKPAILSGMILVGLEVLGDFGVVQYLGLQTFATAIFKSWISFKDLDSAIRLSGVLILVVLLLQVSKSKLVNYKYHSATTSKSRLYQRRKVSLGAQAGMFGFGLIIFSLSFTLPIYQLVKWSLISFHRVRYVNILNMLSNTLFMTIGVSILIVLLALILTSYTRVSSMLVKSVYGKMTLLCYAIPGSVIAMMIIFFFTNLDTIFKLSLSTTVGMLINAYVFRYLGIAYENLENGYQKIGFKYHEASRLLGNSYYTTLVKVDIPILTPFIFSAFSLVFLDLIKELPLTLILRPFNFHTLSTQVYQYASDEMLPESAVPSLIIIFISMIIIISMVKKKRRI